MFNETSNLWKTLLILITAVVFAACGKSENRTTDKQEKTQTAEVKSHEETTVQLPTIQCGMCKKNITKALKKVDGIHEININVEGKVANIMYDKDKTDLSAIENAITGAGYEANDKKADPVAYEKLDECCKVGAH
jgi:copper chaperone CopZ